MPGTQLAVNQLGKYFSVSGKDCWQAHAQSRDYAGTLHPTVQNSQQSS